MGASVGPYACKGGKNSQHHQHIVDELEERINAHTTVGMNCLNETFGLNIVALSCPVWTSQLKAAHSHDAHLKDIICVAKGNNIHKASFPQHLLYISSATDRFHHEADCTETKKCYNPTTKPSF